MKSLVMAPSVIKPLGRELDNDRRHVKPKEEVVSEPGHTEGSAGIERGQIEKERIVSEPGKDTNSGFAIHGHPYAALGKGPPVLLGRLVDQTHHQTLARALSRELDTHDSVGSGRRRLRRARIRRGHPVETTCR